MTRDEVERVINNVEPYYPFKHELNYLKAHDQEQRATIERLWNSLTKVLMYASQSETILEMRGVKPRDYEVALMAEARRVLREEVPNDEG